MGLTEIWQTLLQNGKDTKWPEWVSTVTQIISVWYAQKNKVLVYPYGIIGVLLAAYVYFFMVHPPLYADGALNIYYFFMSVYGWYNWVQKKDESHLTYPISWCSKNELFIGLFVFIFAWAALYFILLKFTNSNTPVLDSLVSSASVTAMWWMAKRKVENWIAWILANIVAIPLNFYKGLVLFTLMYCLFLIMAYWGFMQWKKNLKNELV
jgi:nicotinamide mononucleotide transporter